jgi:Ca-activated chloride channel family protein
MSLLRRVAAALTAVAPLLCAQNAAVLDAASPPVPIHVRMDVPLALIPVQVTSLEGGSVIGLARINFKLFEDGVEQHISYFASEDAPLSMGFLLDTSGSMKNKMSKSLAAAARFLRSSVPDDEFFLVEFNEHPKVTIHFTNDIEMFQHKMVRARSFGRTSLLDAIYAGIAEQKKAHNARRALVILSDGGDNHSRKKEDEIRKLVREADVQVYAIGIVDPEDVPRHTTEEANGPSLLSDLAKETGGKYFPVNSLDELPKVCAQVDHELRSQYLLGFAPESGGRDGRFHKVKVLLNTAGRVTHRPGYYAREE